MVTTKVKLAVEIKLPCTHGPKDICDLCIIWSGISTVHSTAKFWSNGLKGEEKEYSVTVECASHGSVDNSEVAFGRDYFEVVERAWTKIDNGCKLSCGCKLLAAEDYQNRSEALADDLLDFAKDFYRQYAPIDLKEAGKRPTWTVKMFARAKALIVRSRSSLQTK